MALLYDGAELHAEDHLCDCKIQNRELELKGSRLPLQTDTQCPVTTDAVSQQPILNTSICTAEPVSAADDLQLLGEEAAKQESKHRPSKPSPQGPPYIGDEKIEWTPEIFRSRQGLPGVVWCFEV